MPDSLAGRSYADLHRTSGKRRIVEVLAEGIEAAGGRVLNVTGHTRAPVHLSAMTADLRTISAMIYPFTGTSGGRGNPDERRFQLRLGGEDRWGSQGVGWDPSRAEPSIILGVHLEFKTPVLVGVDPVLYDPLPSGDSIWQPTETLERAAVTGWEVWESQTRSGARRVARTDHGTETMVAFTPENLPRYIRLETEAQALRHDYVLRRALATRLGEGAGDDPHRLEEMYGLKAQEILEVIERGKRLGVAVRGGVAEFHLDKHLAADAEVAHYDDIDEDDRPDFSARLIDGREGLLECKNVSPDPHADGYVRVEVQKTRGRIPGRLYTFDRFDVVAACMWAVTGRWEFKFAHASVLDPHRRYPDRLNPKQPVDDRWHDSLREAFDDARRA
jgi:hypothetical protein